MSLLNKVVVVTGSSSGIGAATAISFTKEGANVVIVGRNEKKLKIVLDQCTKAGKKPHLIKADVTKDDDVERIVKETINKFGKLDVLVNNAGMAEYGSILDGTFLGAYDTVMNVNLRAVISLTTLAAPHLIKAKGNIINVSSVAAFPQAILSGFLPYCISKAGLDHFTKGAARELGSFGVRVNSVNPGPVRTDFMENSNSDMEWDVLGAKTLLNRVTEPGEIADLILYLASEKSKGITGSVFVSDNGFLVNS